MKKPYFLFLIPILFLFTSCGSDDGTITSEPPVTGVGPDVWLVPSDQIFDGGPGKDGIPSIDAPKFTRATDVSYLNSDDLVLAIKSGDKVKAYPHPIMDWHEIVNDEIGDLKIALTYCPLTGTGIGWNRVINGSETTFGVSGLLYNTNLMPYDRLTNSTWSQQTLKCVNGELVGRYSENISFIETSFETLKTAYPNALVLNTDTGFSRNYTRFPYGGYRTNTSLLFPVSVDDSRLHPKERTLGVFGSNEPTAFTFNEIGKGMELASEVIDGQNTIIAVSADDNVIVAFNNNSNAGFEPIQNSLPLIMKDSDGNVYNIFGEVEEGVAVGSKLELPTQFIGYWFSWGTFYEELDLVELK